MEYYYEIYQTDGAYAFRDWDFASNMFNLGDYSCVYSGKVSSDSPRKALDDLYMRFNINHPFDFKGRSMSVSDIVTLADADSFGAYYCDDFGWKEITNLVTALSVEGAVKTAHAIQVGDIFCASMGYNALYYEFYQVTRVSDKSIWVRELNTESSGDGSFTDHFQMWAPSWYVRPIPDSFRGNELRKAVRDGYEGRPCFKVHEYGGYAYPWDGKIKQELSD